MQLVSNTNREMDILAGTRQVYSRSRCLLEIWNARLWHVSKSLGEMNETFKVVSIQICLPLTVLFTCSVEPCVLDYIVKKLHTCRFPVFVENKSYRNCSVEVRGIY